MTDIRFLLRHLILTLWLSGSAFVLAGFYLVKEIL